MAELPYASPLVALDEAGPARQVGLRLQPPFPAYLAGLPLPLVPNRVAAMGTLRVLWLGPDEWLVVADGEAPDLLPRLERAVAGRRAARCSKPAAGSTCIRAPSARGSAPRRSWPGCR
jgi:sarcosine oxidase subunit gamma